MEERKVLVISYYFPPMGLSGVQRTLKFVKYLPLYDWKPIVLTTSPVQFYAFDETLNDEIPEDEYQIYRTGTAKDSKSKKKRKTKRFPSYLYQKAGRAFLQTIYQPDSKRPWLKHALKKGDEIIRENNIDVIYATAPPFTDFLVASELSKKHGIPFVVDYRDVWIDNPFHFFATPFHKLYSAKLEREILNNTEKAIVTTRYTKELLLKRHGFISHNDIYIISHGYDPSDFNQQDKINPNPDKLVITHSGLFQDNRTPKYFLKAVSQFFKNKPEAAQTTELRFVGIMRKRHLKYIKKYGLEKNTVCTGYLQHNEVIRHLLESDLLWLMQNDKVRSPGKLYEYFGAKKPVLACVPDGIIKKQVEDYEASFTTFPKDVANITKMLIKMYDMWKNNNLPRPEDNYVKQFNRKQLTGELAKILTLTTEI
ncbi:glycosyltransferase [Bacteroidota bacterium]